MGVKFSHRKNQMGSSFDPTFRRQLSSAQPTFEISKLASKSQHGFPRCFGHTDSTHRRKSHQINVFQSNIMAATWEANTQQAIDVDWDATIHTEHRNTYGRKTAKRTKIWIFFLVSWSENFWPRPNRYIVIYGRHHTQRSFIASEASEIFEFLFWRGY